MGMIGKYRATDAQAAQYDDTLEKTKALFKTMVWEAIALKMTSTPSGVEIEGTDGKVQNGAIVSLNNLVRALHNSAHMISLHLDNRYGRDWFPLLVLGALAREGKPYDWMQKIIDQHGGDIPDKWDMRIPSA